MADDRDDKEFEISISFRIPLHNQQNGRKDETTNHENKTDF